MIFTSCLTNNYACFQLRFVSAGTIHYYYYNMMTIDEYVCKLLYHNCRLHSA